MYEPKISECHRQNLCADCTDKNCIHAGHLYADCPKYHCDNQNIYDCENCDFLKQFTDEMREEYKKARSSK